MEKNVYPFIAAYDLQSTHPDPHSEFRTQAEKEGWSNWIKLNATEEGQLPNTTLHGKFADRDSAVAAFDRALTATRREIDGEVKLTARIIAQIGVPQILPKAKRVLKTLAQIVARAKLKI